MLSAAKYDFELKISRSLSPSLPAPSLKTDFSPQAAAHHFSSVQFKISSPNCICQKFYFELHWSSAVVLFHGFLFEFPFFEFSFRFSFKVFLEVKRTPNSFAPHFQLHPKVPRIASEPKKFLDAFPNSFRRFSLSLSQIPSLKKVSPKGERFQPFKATHQSQN